METVPACIRCDSRKHVRPSGTTLRAWFCGNCNIEFEPEDDGYVGRGRPETIAAAREEFLIREQRRKARR